MGDEEYGFDMTGEQVVGEEEVGGDGPCDKIIGSCFAMCLGIVLFPLSLFALGWNENNYVCTDKLLIWSEENAYEVPGCNSQGIADKYSFFSCPLDESTLQTFYPCTLNTDKNMACTDGTFGKAISFVGVSGQQKAEMYQCTESCTTETQKSGGQNKQVRKCTYSMQWSTETVPSEWEMPGLAAQACTDLQYTGNSNPSWPTNVDAGVSTDYAQGPVKTAGTPGTQFELNQDLVKQLYPDTPVVVTGGNITGAAMAANPWQVTELTTSNTMVSGGYIISCTVARLGCVRLSYSLSKPASPSVLANVNSQGVTAPQDVPGSWLCSATTYQAINGQTLDLAGMIQYLKDANETTTWLIRIGGIIAAWLSVFCCLQPIAAAADIIGDCVNFVPCIGGFVEDFIEGVVNSILCIISCGVGCSCAFFVIAVVWLAMRPLYGGLFLLLSCCCCCGGIGIYSQMKDQGKKPKKAKQGQYKYAPVPPNVAAQFLAALRKEYVRGQDQAVGDFFSGLGQPYEEQLAPFEQQVQSAEDQQTEIDDIAEQWNHGAVE